MKFIAAEKELARLAKGQYCSLEYHLTILEPRRYESKCSVYIDGGPIYAGRTWEKAFAALRASKEGPRPVDLSECPGDPVAEGYAEVQPQTAANTASPKSLLVVLKLFVGKLFGRC